MRYRIMQRQSVSCSLISVVDGGVFLGGIDGQRHSACVVKKLQGREAACQLLAVPT